MSDTMAAFNELSRHLRHYERKEWLRVHRGDIEFLGVLTPVSAGLIAGVLMSPLPRPLKTVLVGALTSATALAWLYVEDEVLKEEREERRNPDET